MIPKLIAITCLISLGSAEKKHELANELNLKEQSTFFVNRLRSDLVEINSKGECKYHGKSSSIKRTLHEDKSKSVSYIETGEMKRLIEECRSKTDKPHDIFDGLLIFPGTKWCGKGDSADNYEDLGEYKKTDMCCRKHDHCPDNIGSGETKHGLTNNGRYTISHCDCDDALRACFHAADEYISDDVGLMFFDTLSTSCFREDYPIVSCLEYGGLAGNSCQKYKLDETKPKIWQIFDGKVYGE